MTSRIDANEIPPDRYGFRIYGVMVHLPDGMADAVKGFHASIGVNDLATRPHCSIHNFFDLSDMEQLEVRLRDVATRHRPLEIVIDLDNLLWGTEFGAYPIEPSPELVELNRDVVERVEDLTKRIFPADRTWWPHTTILLDGSPEEIERGKEAAKELKLASRFNAESFELIGRVGPSRGGEYRVLASFPLNKDG